jgi:PKD repeat protein
VGELEAYMPIDFTPGSVNYADAAVGTIYGSVDSSPGEQFAEGGNYWIEGWTEVSKGDTVRKSGRTTGVTTGEVVSTNAGVTVWYGDRSAWFDDQIMVSQPFSDSGDSGSAADKDGAFVGLLFAGSEKHSIVCKAEHIIAGLGIVVDSPLQIVTAQLPAGQVGAAYEATVQAIGGAPPYAWVIADGALPDGLSLDDGSGVISGTPREGGTFGFTVRVTDDEHSTATRDLSVTVAEPTYSLTISSTSGGSVTTPGEGVFAYEEGTVVNLVAAAAKGYRFAKWTGDVMTIGDANAGSTSITIYGDYSISANFAREGAVSRFLTVSSSAGGSVVRPGEGSFAYEEGTTVALAAEAEEGYRFIAWTGDVDTVDDVSAAETTVRMNTDKSISARFDKLSPCQVQFRADKTEVEAGQAVTFTNETTGGNPPYLAAAWDFDGDGVVDSRAAAQRGQTVTCVYDQPGLYSITLTITGVTGTYSETRRDYIAVNPRDNLAPPTIIWQCPLGGVALIAPNLDGTRPPLTGPIACADVVVSAGAEMWGIYHLVEEPGPEQGTWLWYVPGFASSTLAELEPGRMYMMVVSAPCTLTLQQQ